MSNSNINYYTRINIFIYFSEYIISIVDYVNRIDIFQSGCQYTVFYV